MTFLGFKYVGGRNSDPLYLEVKAAAANLITAKRLPNGAAGKGAAVAAALNKMNKAVNKYVKSAAVVPPAGGAGGAGGPPPANKNAFINMRPLGGRIGTRQGFRQPNNRGAPIKVPGTPKLQLVDGKTLVDATVYKYQGSFYGMIGQSNQNRKPNILYKVRALRDSPPTFTFHFIPANAQEYKLNKNATTGAVTGISANSGSPFAGGNASSLANFEQWWNGVKNMGTNRQSEQFLEFINKIKKPMPTRPNGITNETWAARQATNKANINRLIRITSITPNNDRQANSIRKEFWTKVSTELSKKTPEYKKNYLRGVWQTFLSKMFPVPGEETANMNNRPYHGMFTSWYAGLPQNMTPNARARLFANIAGLPNKSGRTNANYVTNAYVAAQFPRKAENVNNAAYHARVANAYKYRNMGRINKTKNTNLNRSNGKANSAARAAFWTAVSRFMPAAQGGP